ncbi:MAG: phytanoyl-CoA dioxygenase family protein [Lentisphaeria bacterium]|nr:phytanoyl-CoA dioxygenase family protein [Lentisphaeria bacterium]
MANEWISQKQVDQYWEEGYTIIRGVFKQHEMDALAAAIDRWKFFGKVLGRTWRRQNTQLWIDPQKDGDCIVRGLQWPSYHDAIFDQIRKDYRFLKILEPLIGDSAKQIINQVHWKQPGSKVTWALHRDVRSRTPRQGYRDLAHSYVQTGLAVDPHRKENGAMQIVPGSHLDLPMEPDAHPNFFNPEYEDDPRKIDVVMNPGDVALWGPFTIHGGGYNTTIGMDRRLYINGYVKAENCDWGEWAFRNGDPVELGNEQQFIHFEQINDIPHGFYPDEQNLSAPIHD